jgi:Na+/proline symporter
LVFNVLSAGEISTAQGTLIGGGIVLLYTLFGGMWSVAVTTFVQMIVIILGLIYVAWVATDMAGGAVNVISHAHADGKLAWLPTFNLMDIISWFAALFTLALGSIPQQDVFQRVNSSKNEKVAVWGTTLGGIGYFFFAAVPLLIAYSATIVDPAMVEKMKAIDSQLILPSLVMVHMNTVTQIIFFGALLSVIMSTASGTLLAPSVTFSENILKSSFPQMTDKQLLWSTRITVAVFSVLVMIYSMASTSSIHGMVENAYRITLAGAFIPLAAGLFWKRANNLGVSLAILFGLGTWILFEFIGNEDIVEPHLIGLAGSAIGMLIGGFLGKPSEESQINAVHQ